MSKYENLITQPNILSYSDYINNNEQWIHLRLYNDAIIKFKDANKLYDIRYIKELPNTYYWKPSKIIVYYKEKGLTKSKEFSLEKYWNNDYIVKTTVNDSSNIKYVDEETRNTLEIKSINYVSGKAIVHSRLSGQELEIPISLLNDLLFDPLYTIENTFTYKYNLNK